MRDAAATDVAARELIRDDAARRHRTQQALVDLIADAEPFRPGLDRDTAVATFFAVMNSDTYRLLVDQLGWTKEAWVQWLVDVLTRELFGHLAT